MFNFVGKRFWFFLISIVVVVICAVALGVFPLRMGVDFSSGSLLTIGFEKPVEQNALRQELGRLGYWGAVIQRTGQGDYIIRTQELSGTQKDDLVAALTTQFGNLQVKEFDTISPMVATETARNAAIAVIVGAVFMLLYIVWAFRKMPKPFRWGTVAVIALIHDVVIAAGIFAILGALFGWEVNLMFITGILAILGYCINNTVVVFDRLRENMTKGISANFEVVTNTSMVQSLARCLGTSLTTLFAILALMLFVGASIQNFLIILLVGLIAGTFSSLCVAPSLLVVWENREWGRFIPFRSASAKAGGE